METNLTTETAISTDFPSITSGAEALDITPALKKSVNSHYPNLIHEIEKSGYIHGSKFYRFYLSHTDKTGKNQKYIFLKNIPTPSIISSQPSAKKSGRNIQTTIPKNFASLTNLYRTVFIITVTVRGTDYRTLHINLNH